MYPNIVVGPTSFASSGQTRHCWVQHVVSVWPPCCDVLLGIEKRTSAACPGTTLLHEPGQTTTTSCNIHSCCMKNLTIFKFGPTTPNMSQHVATGWPNAHNMLRPTMMRYVTLRGCYHLARIVLYIFHYAFWLEGKCIYLPFYWFGGDLLSTLTRCTAVTIYWW